MIDPRSPAERLAGRFAGLPSDRAHALLDQALAGLGTVELAALAHDWEGFWARPKQVLPGGSWASCGILSGRNFGKTRMMSEYLVGEIIHHGVQRIGVCAQTEDDTRKVIIEGESGLLAVIPPWIKYVYEPANFRVLFPEFDAGIHMYTAEVPKGIRGPQFERFYWDEVAAAPPNQAEEVLSNIDFATRLDEAKFIWSTTPKKVPIIRKLTRMAGKDPDRHRLIRGTTWENASNTPRHKLESWRAEYEGTRTGRQELEGVTLDDVEGALFRQEWIDDRRSEEPHRWLRRAVAVDPAITSRKGSDRTGIVAGGLGDDGRVYITEDRTDKYSPEAWAGVALDVYLRDECDLLILEQNRGGDLVLGNVRAVARERGVEVRTYKDKDPPPPHNPKVVYCREVHARGDKSTRADPIATLYEKGRVRHVHDARLGDLEETMVTWEPSSSTSPDGLDALVHLVWDLAELSKEPEEDSAKWSAGLDKANAGWSTTGYDPMAAERAASTVF